MTDRNLDDPEINGLVLAEDMEIQQTAVWAHLLKDKIDAGEMHFPIENMEQLDPLFVVGEQTTMPTDGGTSTITLRRPGEKYVAPGIFPIQDMQEFVHAAYAVIVFEHTFVTGGRQHKHVV